MLATGALECQSSSPSGTPRLQLHVPFKERSSTQDIRLDMQKLQGGSGALGSARNAALASSLVVNSWLLISTRRPCHQRYTGARFRNDATSSKSVGSDADLHLQEQPMSPAEQRARYGLQPPAAQQQLLPPATPTPQQTTSIHSSVEHHGHPHSSQPSLKYAQMGHSRFSRGAPHVCYWHLDGKGLFYVKPDVDEMVRGWQLWLQQQRQQLGLTAQPDSGHLASAGVEGQGNSCAADDSNTRWQDKMLSGLQSSSLLPVIAAAAAAVVALASAVATATSGQTGSAVEHQQDRGLLVLRVAAVAVVAGVCSIAIAHLGRRIVAFLLLCYSGLSML